MMNDEQMTAAKAQAELDAAQQTVARFESALADARKGAIETEEEVGSAAVENPERLDELAARLQSVRSLEVVTASALERARQNEQSAHANLLRAQAGELRAQAGELRRAAAAIETEAAALLEQLSELQGGVKYIVQQRITLPGVHSDPLPFPTLPRSDAQRQRADRLDAEASQLEQRAASLSSEGVKQAS